MMRMHQRAAATRREPQCGRHKRTEVHSWAISSLGRRSRSWPRTASNGSSSSSRAAVADAGADVELLSIHDGEIQARDHDLDDAGTFEVDRVVTDASVDDYDALLLPGGTVNPDQLRINSDAVSFVRDFFRTGKPIGTICHGPWTLLEAGVVEGRRITSWPSVRTDLRNAGAEVLDEEVVTDQGLVSSRSPDDLPAFCAKVVEEFAEGPHQAR
jgi:protease I